MSNSKEHHTSTINFGDSDDSITSRVITGDRAPLGYSVELFLPHNELIHDPAKNRQFLKDNCLHFRVTRVTNIDQNTRLERQCLAIESRVCVPPFNFTMRDFELRKAENDISYSTSFYTHPRGYRMCLKVVANGCNIGKGTHVSVYVCLMRGEFDNYLKWPFRGEVTVQLLNQIEDKGHHEKTLDFANGTPDSCADRVTASERAASWGRPQFISHRALNYNKNCQYLKYESSFPNYQSQKYVVHFLLFSNNLYTMSCSIIG